MKRVKLTRIQSFEFVASDRNFPDDVTEEEMGYLLAHGDKDDLDTTFEDSDNDKVMWEVIEDGKVIDYGIYNIKKQ